MLWNKLHSLSSTALRSVILFALIAGSSAADSLYYVPGMTNISGLAGTHFSSDVNVVNIGASPANIRFEFIPGGAATAAPVTRSVEPHATLSETNILATFFGLSETFGALRISAEEPVVIAAQTYNDASPIGRFGLALDPVPDTDMMRSGERRHLPWVSHTSDLSNGYRTNVAVLLALPNTSVEIVVYDNAGNEAGRDTVSGGPGLVQRSIASIVGHDLPVGRAEMAVTAGKATGYLALVDNVTGDGMVVQPSAASSSATDVVIDGVVHSPGLLGTFFQTDVRLVNVSPSPQEVRVTPLSIAGHSAGVTVTVPAGGIAELVDVLERLFSAGDGSVGALRFEASGPVLVVARTSNVSRDGSPGTFGAYQKAVPTNALLKTGETGMLIGLRHGSVTPGFRCNLAFLGGEGGAVTTLTLKGPDGKTLATRAGLQLGPFAWSQATLPDYFGIVAVPDNSTLEIEPTSGTLDAYAAMVDNGTGDSVVSRAQAPLLRSRGGPEPFRLENGYRWRNLPVGGGGYVTGFVAHPTEPDLFYIRTDIGGAYRWSSDYSVWVPLLDWLSPDQKDFFGVDGIALAPSDANVVYIAVGAGEWVVGDVWKSTDRGVSWTPTRLNKRFRANGVGRWVGEPIAVDPGNANVVYVGTRYDGLWITPDGGVTWRQAAGIPTDPTGWGVRSVAIDPSSSGRRIMAATRVAGIFVSTDGGATWASLAGGPPSPNQVRFSGDGILFVTSVQGLHLFDGSWRNVSPHVGVECNALAVSGGSPPRVIVNEYAEAMNTPIFLSMDSGGSWTNLNRISTQTQSVTWYPTWYFSAATSTLAWDPSHPNEIFFGDWFNVWKCPDVTTAAPSFVSQPWGFEETATFDLVSPSAGAHLLDGCADNGGLVHTDTISYPAVKYEPQEVTGLDFLESDPRFVVRVSSNGWGQSAFAFSASTDGGNTWEERAVPGTDGRLALSATDKNNIVWIGSSSGPVRYTADSGFTWQDAAGAPQTSTGGFWGRNKRVASDRVNGKKFYVWTSGRLFVSTDGGRNFSAAGSAPQPTWWLTIETVKTAPAVEGELLVTLGDSGLYRSSDSGATLRRIAFFDRVIVATYGIPALSMTPQMFAAGTHAGVFGVYRSQDLGDTWEKISPDSLRFGPFPVSMEGDRQMPGRVFVGTDGRGVFVGELF